MNNELSKKDLTQITIGVVFISTDDCWQHLGIYAICCCFNLGIDNSYFNI